MNWKSRETKIEWGGYFKVPGKAHITALIWLSPGVHASYRLTSGSETLRASGDGVGGEITLDFGTIEIGKPGWRTFWLQGLKTSDGSTFGNVEALNIEGEPANGALFNLKRRRNSASVHLFYPVDKSKQIEWFYNEVTAKEDPIYTYYMACGFNRGYFGMQVNSPTERRIIFSIWDSGKEKVDRSRVNLEDQVQLLDKGPNVVASSFGNEGTGGHSHLSYLWKTGTTQRFLVHAVPQGDKTVYTAYFFQDGQWRLIATFSAPHDGQSLHGLYSFVEDFGGDNGNLKRKALYGPGWVKTATGPWEPLTSARFSHDGTGGKDRFDYDFGVEGGRFYLQNGGFEGKMPKYGTVAELRKTPSSPPKVDIDKLPR